MRKIEKIDKFNYNGMAPSDKSITHRAIMLNAIADGKAVVSNPLMSLDTLATCECMRRLGANVDVDFENNKIIVEGAKKFNTNITLPCENSGTTMRLLCGLVSGLGVKAQLVGDASLSKRPMDRVIQPLSKLGANINSVDGHAPLEILPSMIKGNRLEMQVASAQVKSAVMLAGLSVETGETTIEFSTQTRDHTERMLKAMGADVELSDKKIVVRKSKLMAKDIDVCGDMSSAAFILALGALKGEKVCVKNVGINPTRAGFLKVLDMFGVKYDLENKKEICGEPVCDINIYKSELKPITLGGDIIANVIDELPIIATLASFAKGETIITGAAELRVKESDRIALMCDGLKKMGVNVVEKEDGMVIYGGKPTGNDKDIVVTNGDHRIAMSFCIMGLASEKGAIIDDYDCVAVSFPNFLEKLGV